VGKGWARFRWFEAGIAVAGVLAIAAVGPLREVLAALPAFTVAGAAILFLLPGMLVARWFLGEYFPGISLLPVGLVISVGAFGVMGVPFLVLQSSLGLYLWISGAAVSIAIVAAALSAALGALRREPTASPVPGPVGGEGGGALWLPFIALAGALAYFSRISVPSYYGDAWIYLSWIREFLSGSPLAAEEPFFGGEVGLSRVRINGWLLEQAAFSRVSGVDPIDLAFSYLNPALVVVALLAFYALALTLFKSEKAALFCACLYALFFLVHLGASRLSFGGEFVQRLAEDKLVAKFLFLPIALAFAVAFLESGRRTYFWGFAFLCCAVMAVHPIGLAIIGLSMAGFGVLHLAANPRSRAAWARISAMGVAGLAAVAVPAVFVFALAGESLSAVLTDSDINSGDPDVLRNMIFVSPERNRIFEFADGSYMMHPSLILDPVIAVAFVVGVPFLLWRVRENLAARLLLGTLLLTTLVVYVPPITTFLGDNVVLPGQIWRLAWPIPLAAMLTLGWLLWEVTVRAVSRLGGEGPARVFSGYLPLVFVLALAFAAAPLTARGVERIDDFRQVARAEGFYPVDPIYEWFRDEVRSPAVVLAPDLQAARIPAYSSEANVVSRRGSLIFRVLPELKRRAPGRIEVPRGSLDVREFFNGTDLMTAAAILRRNQVDYVMVRSESPLSGTLSELDGLEPVSQPSERYDLFEVDLERLDSRENVRLPPQ
jgi:hypothetical protein